MFVAVVPYKDMNKANKTLVFDTSDLTIEFISFDDALTVSNTYGIEIKGIWSTIQDSDAIHRAYDKSIDGRFKYTGFVSSGCKFILDGFSVSIAVIDYFISVNGSRVSSLQDLGIHCDGNPDLFTQYVFEYKDYYILRCSFATEERWDWITVILDKLIKFVGMWNTGLTHFIGGSWVKSFAIQCDTFMEI